VPSRETVLPLVGVRIPTASFFWFAPVLAAALFNYVHVHLLQLWDALADAPAQVDGRPLGDRLHAWVGMSLALALKGRGAERHRPLDRLVHLVTFCLIWLATPIILVGFWIRSMPAHDQWLSLTIAAAMLATVYGGLVSWRHALSRLRQPWRAAPGPWGAAAATAVLAVHLGGLTWLATERDLGLGPSTPLVGRLLAGPISTLASADLTAVELVDIPPDWPQPAAARLAFRETWCRQEGIPDDACDRPPEAKRPVPARVLALRADWCAEPPAVADCAGLFARFDEAFRQAWATERDHAIDNLGRLDLAGRDLRRADATEATLVGVDLAGARLANADLRGVSMEGADLRDADLSGARLSGAQIPGAILVGAHLVGADLREAFLEDSNLADADLSGADLAEAVLERAYMLSARLDDADLSTAHLERSDLTVATLARADLRLVHLNEADLRGANLTGADLRWADLRAARWSGAVLAGSPAHYADFRGALDLTQAQLDGLVGTAGTLLPDRLAPDGGAPFSIPSCWPVPPPDFEGLLARLTADQPQAEASLRASLLCAPGAAPKRTGTPCPADRSRESCLRPQRF
jgi:uncharacterized protein YjbI with pentapeptide repeats